MVGVEAVSDGPLKYSVCLCVVLNKPGLFSVHSGSRGPVDRSKSGFRSC